SLCARHGFRFIGTGLCAACAACPYCWPQLIPDMQGVFGLISVDPSNFQGNGFKLFQHVTLVLPGQALPSIIQHPTWEPIISSQPFLFPGQVNPTIKHRPTWEPIISSQPSLFPGQVNPTITQRLTWEQFI